ncbi:MAG: glycosyltransferase family 2 protein [Anaerolineae bacterium]|nr:glycosyltransferase family 2 protein [Anaerolineae bacterium]
MQFPFVTIILPIRNEAKYIQRCLVSVIDQDYPADQLEILVVDGMSDDGTRDIVQSFQQKHPNLKLIDNPQKIVPTGWNIAVQLAKGDFVVRVDGHCIIATDYVRQCLKYLQLDDVHCVGGPIETIGETFTSQAIAVAMSSKFGVGNSAFRVLKPGLKDEGPEDSLPKGDSMNKTHSMYIDTVGIPAFTRQALDLAGLMDEELVRNQDDEYIFRLRKLGARLVLASDIQIKYFCRTSYNALARQYFQYGYWKVRVFQKFPRQMRPRQFIPLVFVLSLIVLLALAGSVPLFGTLLKLEVAAYLVASLTASVLESRKRGWRFLPFLPLIFAILHISYGLGFLLGLFKFYNRWGDKVGKIPIDNETHG